MKTVNVVDGPWLHKQDQKWLQVIDNGQACYTALRGQGIPETEAFRLVISSLLDTIRQTYKI